MRAIVYKSSGTHLGEFEIDEVNQVLSGFQEFAQNADVESYDYIESKGQTWTIAWEGDEWRLKAGRIHPPPPKQRLKAFVFKPSNAPVGKFKVDKLRNIKDGFLKFAREAEVEPYDYIECDGRTWTIIGEVDEWRLHEGRIYPPRNQGSESPRKSGPQHRYNNGYLAASNILKTSEFLKTLAIVLAIVIFFLSFVAVNGTTPGFFMGLVNGIASGAGIYLFGVLLGGIGQILMVNLDQAVHSSPFLSDEQRAEIMSIELEEDEAE